MMHQRRMREKLQSFVDGELSAAEQSWVEHHLESCGECAASLRCLQESDRLFSVARPEPAALSPQAAGALFERVMAESQEGQRAVLRPNAQPFAWAFGAALAVSAGAALAWWGMTAIPPSADGSRAIAQRPPTGLLVADTGTATGSLTAPRKEEGGLREGGSSGSQPGNGAAAKQRKVTPALPTPGAKVPAEETPPRRSTPSRYRYVAVVPFPSEALDASEPASGIELVSGPQPESFVDPTGESSEAPPAAGQLLVLVTPERAPSPIRVTSASSATPGFARASGVRPDGSGGWLWTEATVQNECAGPERSLVILGSSAWPGEEEQNDQVWGEPQPNSENSGDTAGDRGEPVRDPSSVGVSDQDEGHTAQAGEPACDDGPAGPGDIDADGC